jgi:hypothetical protein
LRVHLIGYNQTRLLWQAMARPGKDWPSPTSFSTAGA